MNSRSPARNEVGDFTAAVLAGGRGKRLGMDKTSLEIGGKPILERIITVLESLFPRILVVTQRDNHAAESLAGPGLNVVKDILPGRGPLGGIYTALEYSASEFVFVMACDMPYPNPGLIRLLLSWAPGWEAVVPRRGRYIEPLFAVYRRDVREKIREKLETERLKIHEVLDELRVRYVDEEEMAARDPGFLSFFNINTPEDLEAARRLSGT